MEAYGDSLDGAKAWFDRNVGANAYLVSAIAYRKLGNTARAITVLRHILEIYKDPSFNTAASYNKRRLARTRAMLARLLAASDPETAKSLAQEALAWYRQAGGYEAVIVDLEAI